MGAAQPPQGPPEDWSGPPQRPAASGQPQGWTPPQPGEQWAAPEQQWGGPAGTGQPGGQWPPAEAPPRGSNGLAVGALVCGILALLSGLFGLLVITLPLALLLGIVAVTLGIMGLRRARVVAAGRGQSIAGIITGAVGLLAALAWGVFLVLAWDAMVDEFGDPFQDPEGFLERMEQEQQQP